MRLLLYIILAFVAYQAYKSIRVTAKTAIRRPQAQDREPIATELVEDPVCHTYCPKTEALSLDSQGKTIYFCSEECRGKYLQGN